MFIKDLFVKPNFISFYTTQKKYLVLNERYKKNKIIFSETKEFEEKKELEKYINEVIDDNPQTYISTFVLSPNQGAVPSCNRQKYKEMGIETENIKYICIKNKYSFYTTLYELMEYKKKYKIDFLYPAFAVIDYKSSVRENSLYILVIQEYYYVLIYKNHIPAFSDVFEIQEETFEEDEEIEDISDIDIVDDFDEALDDDIENISESEMDEENNISTFNIEYKILENIKEALKEYYESGGDFIEKIYIFDTIGLEKNIIKMIDEELFIQANLEKFDILKTLNEISRKNV